MRWMLFCAGVLMLCLCGCDASKDGAALSLNLKELNWQTGALIALAYFANSRGHLAQVAGMLTTVLRGLKILPGANTQQSLSAEEAAKMLADLFVKLKGHPELRNSLLTMMQETAAAEAAPAK